MSTKEILTLQFGHYANFIGAHWWNLQEFGFQYDPNLASETEINHDVLYREGLTPQKTVTFTPRLLLSDLKGSLHGLTKDGELYYEKQIPEKVLETTEWNNEIEIVKEAEPSKNELQQELEQEIPNVATVNSKKLEDNIEVWSDFLYTRYHPRSVNIINEYVHKNEDNPFDVCQIGGEIWKKTDYGEEFEDKIRSYLEECDGMQGFQLITEPTNAFAGVTFSCLEHLKDEYNKKTILSFAVLPSYHSDYNFKNADDREKSTLKDTIRLVNLLQSFDFLAENSCLTVPLCTGSKGWRQPGPGRIFKNLNYRQELYYHSSAIIATALETLTLPFRRKNNSFTIGDYCSDLSKNGQKIASASLNVPLGLKSNEYLIDCLDKWEGSLTQSLTPNCKINSDKTTQHFVIRGIPLNRMKIIPKNMHSLTKVEQTQMQMPAYRCGSVQEMLQYYFACTTFNSFTNVTAINTPLNINVPYPDIFSEFVDSYGNMSQIARKESERVKSVPVITGCHSGYGSGIGDMLQTLHRESGRIKIGKLHHFKTHGLEDDEYKECLSRILDLQDCYDEF